MEQRLPCCLGSECVTCQATLRVDAVPPLAPLRTTREVDAGWLGLAGFLHLSRDPSSAMMEWWETARSEKDQFE